ncbi:hypothetical protein KHS38_01390 [Mucilaginibacter sp. Bleaf8]|nr:hypothetical protein [Mucilaginibacter sp. Bleaf8]
MPVFYSKITVYEGSPNNNNGKTIYRYGNFVPHSESTLPTPRFKQPEFTYSISDPYLQKRYIKEYNYWCTSQLVGTELFERNGSEYKLRKSSSYYYEPVSTGTYRGLLIDKYIEFDNFQNDGFRFATSPFELPTYQYADYYVSTGHLDLKSSSESIDGVVTTTNYTYNSHLLKDVISVAKSNGDTIKTAIIYPFDFIDDIYKSMVIRNMIDFNVVSEVSKGGG